MVSYRCSPQLASLFGACIIMATLIGTERAYSVWYVQILEQYDSGAAITAWIGGINNGIRCLLSPVASSFCRLWSPQKVALVGSLLIGLSAFLTAFAKNLTTFLIYYSIIGGIGGCLLLMPCYVVIQERFDKYQAIAFSIVGCGGAFGCIVYPMIYTHLFQSFSYFEAVTQIAGVILQSLPAAALLGPTEEILSEKKDQKFTFEFKLFKSSIVGMILIGTFLLQACMFPYMMLIVDFAIERGFSLGSGALIPTLSGITDALGIILVGIILHNQIIRSQAFILCVICTAGIAITTLMTPQAVSWRQFVAGPVLNMGFNGAFFTAAYIAISVTFNQAVYSDIVGLFNAAIGCGMIIGPLVSGALRDVFKSYVPSYYLMIVEGMTAFISYTACSIWIFRLRKENNWLLRSVRDVQRTDEDITLEKLLDQNDEKDDDESY